MTKEWYEKSFGEDYLIIYKHRDMQGAQEEVHKMTEWLSVPQGATVLDLCCGMGRHSLAMADLGYTVTGMDLSDVLLTEARNMDKTGQVRWIKGDMRSIPLSGPFDAVVNLFTSFGYFSDDAENRAVLLEMERVLLPGGRFILDFMNVDHVADHLVPTSERKDGLLLIQEKRSIEDGYVRKCIVLAEPGKPDRTYLEQVKLYKLEDFKRLFTGIKLEIDHVYGDYNASPFIPTESSRLILVGTRKEDA